MIGTSFKIMRDRYPQLLYKNVLLLDGKIVGWKTGTTHWPTVHHAFGSKQYMWLFRIPQERMSVESCSKLVHNSEENNNFFSDTDFYKQFPIHEKFDGFKPFKNLE